MNGTNRHAAYRRKLQRKRKIRRILILCGILLLLLAAGFLILGTLSARTEQKPSDTDTEQNEEEDPISSLSPIKAHPLYLETADTSTLASRLQALRRQSVTDASVPLNQEDGSLLYTSSLAASLGADPSDYTVTVQKASTQSKNYGIRLHGLWHVTAFEEKNALLRSVLLSETAALLADALQNGMSDILLLAPELRPEALEELLLLSEQVHRLFPDGALGLCIPSSFLESEEVAILVDDLVQSFDFLAINATEASSDETASAHIEEIASANLDRLLRYNMRLLLPYAEESDAQASIIAAAEQYSAKSWQILP
ncbi:MAG: hypothetical protein IKA76_08050 [Clostridia bacterium]|nr:hypothetical protein [Clostridia bacterium]